MIKNGTDVETQETLWWLQRSKGKYLRFCRASFGTERSEVRILSPRPIKHQTAAIIGGRISFVANLWTSWRAIHRGDYRSSTRPRGPSMSAISAGL